jgi:subtilisin-like proprotein convertase family protein
VAARRQCSRFAAGLRALTAVGLAAAAIAVPASASGAETPRDTGFVIVGSKNSAGFGLVRVFADTDNNGTYETLVDEFVPYATTVGEGVRVGAGDFDGDGNDELVTASSENAPVKIYELGGGGEKGALAGSVAGFAQGSYVAAGDLNGDGRDELIVGADPGGEPKVKIFADLDGDGELGTAPVNSFNAYPAGFTGGVRVAAANTDESTFQPTDAELITGPGPNGPGLPVKIWDDTDHDGAVSDNPIDDSFLPYDAGFGGGTYVAAGPIDFAGSVAAEVIVSPASGQNRNVVIRTDTDLDGKVSDNPPFDQLPPPYGATFASGVRVAAGDSDHSAFFAEVITAPGANAGSKPVKIYDDDGDPGSLISDNPLDDQFTAFPGSFGEFVAFAGALSTVYSDTDTPLFIPDDGNPGDPLRAVINVPRSAGVVRDLDVALTISHTNNADLDVTLTHTGGGGTQVFSLFTDVGNNDDGFMVWLSDEAPTDIGTAPDDPQDRPVAGTFTPEGGALLSTFDGVDASGTWTLTVDDDAIGDTGMLLQWSLKITY